MSIKTLSNVSFFARKGSFTVHINRLVKTPLNTTKIAILYGILYECDWRMMMHVVLILLYYTDQGW